MTINIAEVLKLASVVDDASVLALTAGVAAPPLMAVASTKLVRRAYQRDSKRLLAIMLELFAFKFLFYAIYVVTMLAVFKVNPYVFIAGFTVAFLISHVTEAFSMRRLVSQ